MPIYSAAQIYGFARAAGFTPDQAATMTAIALAESGGNPMAHNPDNEDSRGLWQINLDAHSDWAAGMDLFDPVQNARAAFRVSGGGADISPWTVTHGGTGARYVAYQPDAEAAAAAYGDGTGLGVFTGTGGYGDVVPAGGGAGGGAAQVFLGAALRQTGDTYEFGAEADAGDADPDAFDCSELVQWAAAQAGVTVPDGSWAQYLHLQQQGALIPVEQAAQTPGALLFSFSAEPTPGGARPDRAHVAISLGDGRTIEARGTDYGVGSFEAGPGRFQYAAVIPGMEGGANLDELLAGQGLAFPRLLDPNSPDSDSDGLTDALEARLGTDPATVDSDRDGLSDAYEVAKSGTDPLLADTDADRVPDAFELAMGTDPTDPDTDKDGRLDGATDTLADNVDSDADRLTDALEDVLGTDSSRVDSDADGFTDALEHQAGFDPNDPASNPLTAALLGQGPGGLPEPQPGGIQPGGLAPSGVPGLSPQPSPAAPGDPGQVGDDDGEDAPA